MEGLKGKKFFARERNPAARTSARDRVSAGFAFWICVSDLAR